jgi:hypothetical protein
MMDTSSLAPFSVHDDGNISFRRPYIAGTVLDVNRGSSAGRYFLPCSRG